MELLAEYKGDCDGLFLKLDKDAQESLPYDEKDQGYKAYWGTDDEAPDGDDDDDENSSEEAPVIVNYTITGLQGTDESTTRSSSFEGYGSKLFFAWSDGGFLWIKDGNGDAAAIIGGSAPWNASGIPQSGLLQIGGVTVSRILPDGSSSPPKDTGNPNDPPKPKVIVKRLKEDKTEETIATIPRPAKPTEAVFICEDCEINCVLLIRKKTDKFAVGICICNKEEDWILTKAQVKAELLQELPPIIQARLKAQEIPGVKTEVKTELREAFSTDISGAAANIKSELKADDEFKGSLIETVKQGLEEDIEFRTYISGVVYECLRNPRFLEGFMSQIKTNLLSDSDFLESLKTKLGVTASPTTPTGTGTTGTSSGNPMGATTGPMTGGTGTPTTGMPGTPSGNPMGTTTGTGTVPGMTTGTTGTSGGSPFTQPFPTATPVTPQPFPTATPVTPQPFPEATPITPQPFPTP